MASSLLGESSDTFAPICNFHLWIMKLSWLIHLYIIHCSRFVSVILLFLNSYLDRIYSVSYEKHLIISFKKWIQNIEIVLFFISPERVDVIAETRMYLLILLSCYYFYIILSGQYITSFWKFLLTIFLNFEIITFLF